MPARQLGDQFDRAHVGLLPELALRRLERLFPVVDAALGHLPRTGVQDLAAALAFAATEERVAVLAASGHTNRQVATALFLSPRTVEANLARVYRKLGVSSRAELGAVMARREPSTPPS